MRRRPPRLPPLLSFAAAAGGAGGGTCDAGGGVACGSADAAGPPQWDAARGEFERLLAAAAALSAADERARARGAAPDADAAGGAASALSRALSLLDRHGKVGTQAGYTALTRWAAAADRSGGAGCGDEGWLARLVSHPLCARDHRGKLPDQASCLGTHAGVLWTDPLQVPGVLWPGLRAAAWWDTAELPVAAALARGGGWEMTDAKL
eukprot:gene27918-6286_t